MKQRWFLDKENNVNKNPAKRNVEKTRTNEIKD